MSFYYTVDGVFEKQTVVERSKFICYLKGIDDEKSAKEFVDAVSKKNSLATHNCYAYIADENGYSEKFSDDGEPQGTAGKPILEMLKKNECKKIVAVVTRYFGGIKLGTGGLARAYGNAVSECLKSAKIKRMLYSVFADVKIDYDGYNAILRLKVNNLFNIIDSDFNDGVFLRVAVPIESSEKFIKQLTDVTFGKVRIELKEKGYYGY